VGSLAIAVIVLASGGVTVRGDQPLPTSPPRTLSFLHVGPISGPSGLHQVVDQQNREVLLKGVNVDGITDYFRGGALTLGQPIGNKLDNPYSFLPSDYAAGGCVPDVKEVEGVPICSPDFDQMRPLGYNLVRLTLSWSLLEPTFQPTPGVIDQTYMDRIAQVVAWAKAQGIYILLDLHQDAWSKYDYTTDADQPACVSAPPPPPPAPPPPALSAIQGYDGAPYWASRNHRTIPACALNGIREFDAAVQDDFRTLYDDAKTGTGLFPHFQNVFLALANRFHDEPAVAGYEIFNEPSPGFLPTGAAFDESELFQMDGKIINYVVANVTNGATDPFKQLFFVEPNALRNLTDQGLIVTPWTLFSTYPHVVYAPHIYTGVFTLDQNFHQHIYPANGGYNSSILDAQSLGLPLVITEFGNSPGNDNTILRNHYILQDQDQVGGTLWLWKENANDIFGNSQWGVYYGDFATTHAGIASPTRVKYTDRAYPLFTAGHLQTFVYNPDDASFDLHATSPAVAQDASAHQNGTLLFVPAATTCTMQAENADLEMFSRASDGSREVYAYPRGGTPPTQTANYRVFCAASPVVPEAPSAILLPLMGIAAAGLVLTWTRRRGKFRLRQEGSRPRSY
jgi:endoglycosylceramidase